MIFFGIVILIAAIFGVVYSRGEVDSYKKRPRTFQDDGLPVIGLVLLFGGIISLVINIAISNIGGRPESQHYCDLQAIAPDNAGHGEFFLGSGTLDSGPVYVYYCKDAVGYQAHTIDVRDAWIIEDAGKGKAFEKPVVRVNNCVKSSRLWSVFNCNTDYVTEFHIPPGTVKRSYNINGG